jgi:hypothetical protein
MSIFEGALDTTTVDTWINSVSSLLINTAGFTLVSDSGTDLTKSIILSKSGFTHKLKLFVNSNRYVQISLLRLDDVSIMVTSGGSASYVYLQNYRLVFYRNTIALFLSYFGTFRCVFIYTKSDNNYIQILRVGSFTVNNVLVIYGQSNDNQLNIFPLGFAFYQSRTISLYQVLIPIYSPNDANNFLFDNPIESLYSFPNSTSLGEGTKISVNGGSYIVSSDSNNNRNMLIKYAD